jgi:hypothetical protein
MPNSEIKRKEGGEERRVWDLLTRNFYWSIPSEFKVRILGRSRGTSKNPVRLQIFEISVAAIFARLRPEFDWFVTPNQPDGGVDFVGQGRFLEDAELGIAAAITIGGQCKKRSAVKDIVQEISGSLARMTKTINPTFFVVALSARNLTSQRLSEARQILEDTHRRHCHILDRHQLEGLISDHLDVIDPILKQSLSDTEARDVLKYFGKQRTRTSGDFLEANVPDRVLAGVPFRVALNLRSLLVTSPDTRLWWKPPGDKSRDRTNGLVTLIGPIGADSELGVQCSAHSLADDPLTAQISLEMVSYAVGRLDLGEVIVGRRIDAENALSQKIRLGKIQVVENTRPRFFERPFRSYLTKLTMEYERTLARKVNSIAIVGAGGSGKSRLCEEFSLEKRRRGCNVVQAKQTKTFDDPHRILADLLIGLASLSVPIRDPVESVIRAISQYDKNLADRSAHLIQSIVGMERVMSGTVTDQGLLSSLLVLICASTRTAPLIVHLQDLHWCTADVLLLLERLVWQLEMTYTSNGVVVNNSSRGAFFIFEGRIWESQQGFNLWSTRTFEVFIEKLGCSTITCAPFEPADSLEFVRRLFEDRSSARRLIDTSLLTLQGDLVEQIHHTAGGNPFHTLEQIQILKERRVLGQNPETGLLYMIRPIRDEVLLPNSVFDAIRVRWEYLKSGKPELATLLWGASLLEDRIPGPLFRHLWRLLAPNLSLSEIDNTEFLWTGNREQGEVSFRHENYFQSLRRLTIPPAEHERVIQGYVDWFAGLDELDATGKFSWARILLQSPKSDPTRVHSLLRAALNDARRRGDVILARRVLITLLDYTWSENTRSAIKTREFIRCCEEEVTLCSSLLGVDLVQAAHRTEHLRDQIRERLSSRGEWKLSTLETLQLLLLTADVLYSQILFNDRQPARASDVAAEAIRDIKATSNGEGSAKSSHWQILEMEALHSYGVALALAGEIETAIDVAEQAVAIARQSANPSLDVISTYANILLAKEPETAESILRNCLVSASTATTVRETRDTIEINLSMALILRAHGRMASDPDECRVKLAEASTLLKPLFSYAFRVGRYPDAGAAALLLGIISALNNDGDEVSWFTQAVIAAARGGQMETLWRSHINLATSLHRRNARAQETLRDHARAALEILEETLSSYPQPDKSARFALICIPLAHAVRFLIQLGDELGVGTLERYPSLRKCFQDLEHGILRKDRGGYKSHEWLNVEEWDYVIY